MEIMNYFKILCNCLGIFLFIQYTTGKIPTPRIVGGDIVTNFTKFSYQVSLQHSHNNAHYCGGTIIDKHHVLTAAHCTVDDDGDKLSEKAIQIGYGAIQLSDLKIFSVDAIFLHEYYNRNIRFDNDIAVIRIDGTFDDWDIKCNEVEIDDDTECTVSGWGVQVEGSTTISPSLRQVDINYQKWKTCYENYFQEITTNMICAGGLQKDSCQGDSGGPLVCNKKLVGIVSWGRGCADVNYYGVYTKVANYNSWIQAQISLARVHVPAMFLIFFLSILIKIAT